MNGLIGFWGIGSGADTANRNMGWNIRQSGWTGFVENMVKPMMDLGLTRIQLHNPGGTLPNEIMQGDQFVDAKEAGLTWVYKDFVKAIRPVVEQGIEVIAYLGTLPEDDLTRLQSSRRTLDSYLQRLVDSYQYPIDAGCSIAFDAMHQNPETSPEYHWMRLLQGLGIKTYIEPWPSINRPHFWDCNHQSTVQLYNHMLNRDGTWAAPRSSLTGEASVIMNSPPTGRTWADYDEWCPKWCRQMQAENIIPIVSIYHLKARQERIEDWLNREYIPIG